MNIECRISKLGILSILKKKERNDSILRNSAVRYSNQVKFHKSAASGREPSSLPALLLQAFYYCCYSALRYSGFNAILPSRAWSIRFKVVSLSFGSLAFMGR